MAALLTNRDISTPSTKAGLATIWRTLDRARTRGSVIAWYIVSTTHTRARMLPALALAPFPRPSRSPLSLLSTSHVSTVPCPQPLL